MQAVRGACIYENIKTHIAKNQAEECIVYSIYIDTDAEKLRVSAGLKNCRGGLGERLLFSNGNAIRLRLPLSVVGMEKRQRSIC